VPNNACCHYLLDYTDEKRQIVEKVCVSLNLVPFAVNKKTEDNEAPIKDRIPRTINQWLAGFYKANYVVVDSFHALVFSLLFNKEFVVIGNKQRGLDRFKSLLDIVDLSERLIYKASDLTDDMINREINWRNVNNKLEIERKKSRTFLIDALNG
jgi:exopolysaccharide biosynthesis predicted pyruvyltransferase EpsI